MKLLVMGAGYVGMALLTYLHNTSHEIFITTTKEERVDTLIKYGQYVLVLRPNEHTRLHKLINACDGMVIMVAPGSTQNYVDAYLNTAKSIVSALHGRKDTFYIIYTSSTSVCEGLDCEWVTEEIALNPQSENAKILLETECCYLNCEAKTCILRLGGIYGPQREIAERARRLAGKVMPGSGDQPTNNIHVEDIVRAIAFCLEHSLTGIYHLINDDHINRKTLYSNLCQSMALPCPVWKFDALPHKQVGYKVSNLKIKKAGFVFQYPKLS